MEDTSVGAKVTAWWKARVPDLVRAAGLPSDVADDCLIAIEMACWRAEARIAAGGIASARSYVDRSVRRELFCLLRMEKAQRGNVVSLSQVPTDRLGVLMQGAHPARDGSYAPDEVLEVVRSMASGDRVLLELYYGWGLTDAQVASRLGISSWAASKRRYRMLARIRGHVNLGDRLTYVCVH